MVYLVISEFIPEALEAGEPLRRGGKPELAAGVVVGVAAMVPLSSSKARFMRASHLRPTAPR